MRAAYLLGFRGAGKTTLGRSAAASLGWKFLDLDEEWEKRQGTTILAFISLHGEARFRELEAELLGETQGLAHGEKNGILFATGGGIVDYAPSREILSESAVPKIYIEVTAAELWARLEAEPERRKIGGLTDVSRLSALLERRRPFYEKIATYSVKNQDITLALIELKRLLSRI